MNRMVLGCVTVLALGLAALPPLPAGAAIRCNDAYQINSQGEFRSPYCEDGYLAKVAGTYGWHVTGAQVRASYSLKGDICRAIGADIRVDDICSQFRRQDRGRDCKFLPC